MQVELIYRDGQFHPAKPLKLKHEGIKFIVEVPDDEVEEKEFQSLEQSDSTRQRASSLRQRLDHVLDGKVPDDAALPSVSKKSDERVQAMSSRKDQ